jgi:hypothetical protein
MKTPKTLSTQAACLTTTLTLTLTLSLGTPAAHATTFATFQLVTLETGESVALRPDAYPGKVSIANRSNQPLCIDYKILDAQANVLHYSKLRVPIPAGRTDLAIRGPGENARRILMSIDVGVRPPCGPSSNKGYLLDISPNVVRNNTWHPVGFDASRWSGNQRDVLVDVRQP